MTRFVRIFISLMILAGLGGAGFLALAWEPAIPPVEPQPRSAFDPALVAEGARLALIGSCNICHTKADGQTFAGGRPLETPFGTIYSTNISPDPETGIGRWPPAAFLRALREGVDREGRHLYPAFPYHHFTKLTDDDIKALYAFMMTREAVSAPKPPNVLPFPLNIRAMLVGWKLLFLEKGVFEADPSKSEEWNRGAYLVEWLGHCGACHTPFNLLGAEKKHEKFSGGQSESWKVPALNAKSTAPVPWTSDQFYLYLHERWDDRHGMSAGPMAEITRNLSAVPEQDVRAMATYLASLTNPPERQEKASTAEPDTPREAPLPANVGDDAVDKIIGSSVGGTGAAIFAGICARCHEDQERLPVGITPLSVSTTVAAPEPDNLIHIILEGIDQATAATGRTMPPFADILSDRQIAAVAVYVRAHFAGHVTQRSVENDVRRIRKRMQPSSAQTAGGDSARAPALLVRYGCAGCHTIADVPGARGLAGPPLDDVGKQIYVAGVLTNTPANLVRWITDPQSIKPKTTMPNTGISEEEARDIAEFLYAR